MDTWTPIVTVGTFGIFLWLGFLVFQFADVGQGLFDARTARDRRVVGSDVRRRLIEFFWSIPVTAALGVVLAFLVDYVGRLFFDDDQVLLALVVAAAVVVLALFAGLGLVWAMTRPEPQSYATIRADLEDELAGAARRSRLDAFRAEIVSVDKRVGYLRTYPQRTITNLLWTRTPVRLVPVVVALVPFVCAMILVIGSRTPALWWLPLLCLVAPAVSYLLAWAAARASLKANIAWRAVWEAQRTEVEGLLAGAEKSTRKGVAGLGERVTKALQILREQQG